MTRFFLFCLASLVSTSGLAKESPKVQAAMGHFYGNLSQLMPYLSSRSDLTKEEAATFAQIVEQFRSASHKIDISSSFIDQDPALRFVATKFADNMDRAARLARSGKTRYAKRVLQTTVGFCIACHSRTDRGLDFASLPDPNGFAKLSAFDKGNFFTATRQFDNAVTQYEISQVYFESCIRTAPHTNIARSCFEQLEKSSIPPNPATMAKEDTAHLNELRKLAK